MTTRELIHEKREEILALAAKHKAKHIRVFGSVVRGEDTADSDVDFVVAFEDSASLFDQIGLKLDLEDLLGRSVDVVEDEAVHWLIKERVLQEAQPV
ncbi:MAG: nucleotidyltransferase family protein [Armatimonadota bacterium]